jgi:hypothetical protein
MPNDIDEEEQFNEDEDTALTIIDNDVMDTTQSKEQAELIEEEEEYNIIEKDCKGFVINY